MATGDQSDFIGRLKAVLPQGWFGGVTPVLDAILSAPANALAWAYSMIQYAMAQILIGTSSSIWIDLHAQDFFGQTFLRRVNEADASFGPRMQAAIFPAANTRAAVSAAVENLTGRAPKIFEPTQPMDTGAYGYGGLGYGVAGGYGSLELPFQAFLTAYRQTQGGVANIGGYFSTPGEYAPGGYGTGALEYVTIDQAGTQSLDAEIIDAIAAAQPSAAIIWTAITNS